MRSEQHERFAAACGVVWAQLCAVEQYATWWSWLREFDGRRLVAGESWRCAVRSPLLITLRFTIHLDRVQDFSVDATLSGDLTGRAALQLADVEGATELVLRSMLTPTVRSLRLLTRVLPGLAERAHDRVIDAGLRQFRQALDEAGS